MLSHTLVSAHTHSKAVSKYKIKIRGENSLNSKVSIGKE